MITEGTESIHHLQRWLSDEPELRTRAISRPPTAGEMGTAMDTLAVILAPGGAAVVLVSALLSWLRSRTSNVRLEVRHGDRKLSLTADRVRQLNGDDLTRVVDSAVRELDLDGPTKPDNAD
jgi:hypothetical protein